MKRSTSVKENLLNKSSDAHGVSKLISIFEEKEVSDAIEKNEEPRELTEDEKEKAKQIAKDIIEEAERVGGVDNIDEGFFGKAFGTVAGWLVGPTLGEVVANALGVEKGILYEFLTSRLAGAAVGNAIAKHLEKEKIAKVKVK